MVTVGSAVRPLARNAHRPGGVRHLLDRVALPEGMKDRCLDSRDEGRGSQSSGPLMVSPSIQAEADHPRVTDPQERALAQTLAQPPDARREVEHCGDRLNSITM